MRKAVFGFVAIGALMATPALAADIARRAPTPYYKAPPPPVFSWTGCYAGADVGGGWVTDKDSETLNGGVSPLSPISSAKTAGVLVGGYVGCDYQFANGIVIGAVGDGQWADIRGGSANFNTPMANPPDSYQPKIDFQASARGRVGYAFNRVLVYATGGAAWLNVKEHDVFPMAGVIQDTSKTQPGWTVGGGFDYAFTNNLIGRVEYRYSDFGTFSYNLIAFPGFTENHKITENQVTVGLHYKFGSPFVGEPY